MNNCLWVPDSSLRVLRLSLPKKTPTSDLNNSPEGPPYCDLFTYKTRRASVANWMCTTLQSTIFTQPECQKLWYGKTGNLLTYKKFQKMQLSWTPSNKFLSCVFTPGLNLRKPALKGSQVGQTLLESKAKNSAAAGLETSACFRTINH